MYRSSSRPIFRIQTTKLPRSHRSHRSARCSGSGAQKTPHERLVSGGVRGSKRANDTPGLWARPCGERLRRENGPENARRLVRSKFASGSRISTPASLVPLPPSGTRPQPVQQERATAKSCLLRISCYLAFALAAAAAVAEGSAKAITASPSTKLDPGLPPKP
jgi:hypothetical protein